MKKLILSLAFFLSLDATAGVYKCTDAEGHTDYQSSPCTEDHKAVQINTKTGSKVDLNELEGQKAQADAEKKQLESQQQAEEKARLDAIELRKKQAREQSQITLELTKKNSLQFSAFAIPPYDPENLPKNIKPFEERLVDIEKYRRLAAQKALATDQCQRVEADELSGKSTLEQLVFLVNCSSGSSFSYSETELKQ
jgi:hypothetical protein